jgi:hypothetical protein
MWRTDTLWFDVAMVMTIFAVGNVLFGRFEEHRPRGWRLLKQVDFLALVLGLSATLGRAWAYGVLALPLAAAAYVHGVWLPRHGVSGWTAEPRDRYLELVQHRGRGRRPRAGS